MNLRRCFVVCLGGLTACAGPDFESGNAAVCLKSNGGTQVHEAADGAWNMSGRVAEVRTFTQMDESSLNCSSDGTTAIDIVDLDGNKWTLGYGMKNNRGKDAMIDLDVQMDSSVDLLFRQGIGDGVARGFVLRDGAGLVAAMDNGLNGGVLSESDLPGLQIHRGSDVGVNQDDCGKMEGTVIEFEADERTTVVPFGHKTIEIDGKELTAYAIDSYYWSKATCDDEPDLLSWAVFR